MSSKKNRAYLKVLAWEYEAESIGKLQTKSTVCVWKRANFVSKNWYYGVVVAFISETLDVLLCCWCLSTHTLLLFVAMRLTRQCAVRIMITREFFMHTHIKKRNPHKEWIICAAKQMLNELNETKQKNEAKKITTNNAIRKNTILHLHHRNAMHRYLLSMEWTLKKKLFWSTATHMLCSLELEFITNTLFAHEKKTNKPITNEN